MFRCNGALAKAGTEHVVTVDACIAVVGLVNRLGWGGGGTAWVQNRCNI